MKWRKLGKIFDPTQHKLPNGCIAFAQAPQVLVFDSFVRIYFSTRAMDENGLYLSYIAFVDFDKQFKNVLGVSKKTVIPLGKLGCFDEHGIFPLHVARIGDKIFGYISGINRRVSVSVDSSIGLAISNDDGESFQRIGQGPILTSSLHEPFLICDPFVYEVEKDYQMLYVFGKKWIKNDVGAPERVYKIGAASSTDGVKWVKSGKQLVPDKIDDNECQALPTVIKIDDKYHMFFCFRASTGFRSDDSKSYKLGYAYSTDAKNWTRADQLAGLNVSENDWDSGMICYPHIFELEGKIYLLYNGNEFGRYGFGLAELIND